MAKIMFKNAPADLVAGTLIDRKWQPSEIATKVNLSPKEFTWKEEDEKLFDLCLIHSDGTRSFAFQLHPYDIVKAKIGTYFVPTDSGDYPKLMQVNTKLELLAQVKECGLGMVEVLHLEARSMASHISLPNGGELYLSEPLKTIECHLYQFMTNGKGGVDGINATKVIIFACPTPSFSS